MTASTRIRRPDEAADRPRPWSVLAVFVLGLLGGLALVHGTMRQPRRSAVREETEAPAPAARPTTEVAEPPATAAAEPPADPTTTPAARAPASSVAPTPAPASAGERPEPADMPGRHRSVLPGRLAYLQCVGLERPGQAFPCPRDPALEAAAWEVLLSLPQCEGVDVGAGTADVRLHFGLEGPPRVQLRAVPGADPLSMENLRTCAGAPLEALRTRLRSSRMVLSLRFRVR